MLVVTVLAVTVYGHPTIDVSDASFVEPITNKLGFVHGLIKDIKTNVYKQKQNIKNGVVDWMKKKIGLSTTNAEVEPTTMPDNYFESTELIVDVNQSENTMASIYEPEYETTQVNYAATEVNSITYDYQKK
jgi:hypothetical protein